MAKTIPLPMDSGETPGAAAGLRATMNKARTAVAANIPAASVAELLEDAGDDGRLVFFTGAGISASAGVPLGEELADAIRFMVFLDCVEGTTVDGLDPNGFHPSEHVRRRVGQLLARCVRDVAAAALDWMPRKAEERAVLLAFDRFCQTATVGPRRARASAYAPKPLHQLDYADLFAWRFGNHRRARDTFIRNVVGPYSSPSVEHLLLADLAYTTWQRPTLPYPNAPRTNSVHPVIFTLNFDHLLERALYLIGAGVHTGGPPGRSGRQTIPYSNEILAPAVIHLHGNAGSGTVSTSPEMKEQSKRIRERLGIHLTHLAGQCGRGLCIVVLGYGGHSSDALFRYLKQVTADPARPNVYWGCRGAGLPPQVAELLKAYGPRARVLELTLSAAEVLERIWEGLRCWPVTSLYRRERRWLGPNRASPQWSGPSRAPGVTPSVDAAFDERDVPYWALSPLCRADVRLERLKDDYNEIRRAPASDRARIVAWQADAETELQVLNDELQGRPCRFRHHVISVRYFMRWDLHCDTDATDLKHALEKGWEASDHKAFLNLVSATQRVVGALPLQHARRSEATKVAEELERELRRPAPDGEPRGPALRAMIGLS